MSANIYAKSEIDPQGLGGAVQRSISGAGGRANLNWQATDKDFVQLNAIEVGKRLVPQGITEPNLFVNAGWRHKVNDRMTLVLTGQDLLKTNHYREELDTPELIYRLVHDYLDLSRRDAAARLQSRDRANLKERARFRISAGQQHLKCRHGCSPLSAQRAEPSQAPRCIADATNRR